MKKYLHNQKGQALILIVLAIVGLIGLVALAIDGGNAFSDRRHAQGAADAASLAAALAKAHVQDWSNAGMASAYQNEYTNDGTRSIVTVNNPPGPGCDGLVPNPVNLAADPGDKFEYYIQVIIRSNVDTYFAPVVGIDQVHNCVEAVARGKPSVVTPIGNGNGLVSLDPHSCSALWSHGTAVTNIVGSGVFVNSDCPNSALLQSGNSLLASAAICVVGGATYDPGDVAPAPQTHCGTQLPYPPEYIWPQPTCASAGTQVGNTVTPGNIPGSWIAGDVTLTPGTYCINGSVSINAHDHIIGNNVLLYLANGGLTINGGAEVILSAQNNGDYAGLLIFLPITNSNTVIMNGNGNSKFTGTILAPASEIQINGTNSPYGYHSQFIGKTVNLTGTASTYIVYNDNENYDITLPPNIQIVQ
jgi:hypothetical protein